MGIAQNRSRLSPESCLSGEEAASVSFVRKTAKKDSKGGRGMGRGVGSRGVGGVGGGGGVKVRIPGRRDSANVDGTYAGAVYVALLSRSGAARAASGGQYFSAGPGGPLRAAAGAATCIGSAVAGVGDLDGNGVPDMVVRTRRCAPPLPIASIRTGGERMSRLSGPCPPLVPHGSGRTNKRREEL